uniref:Uncharacterized protein n=1 Tax=Helianthus annuus TaxID=4232 RepID=A0A251VRR0_HELAN
MSIKMQDAPYTHNCSTTTVQQFLAVTSHILPASHNNAQKLTFIQILPTVTLSSFK